MESMKRSPLTSRLSSLYQKAVTNQFKNLKKGRCRIIHPSGLEETFGNDQIADEAIIHIKDTKFWRRCVFFGDIGFSESYILGEWDSPDLTKVFSWFLYNVEQAPTMSGSQNKVTKFNLLKIWNFVQHQLNKNDKIGSRKNIMAHYDLSNDFFKLFLDPTMTYSCGVFDHTEDLEQAQRAKFKAMAEQLNILPGQKVLEIGSGWLGFSSYLIENYDCHVTTVTISQEQYDYCQKIIREKGYEKRIKAELKDYREITGQFDRIVSIEMMEAIGHDFIPVFIKKCHELLKPNGLFSFQVITSPDSRYEEFRKGVDFIQKYIFPGSLLPSIGKLNESFNKVTDMHMVKFKDIGLNYAKTLNLWHKKFEASHIQIKELGFDETFIRKWRYYFQYCEAAFATRNISVVQMTYSRPNNMNF